MSQMSILINYTRNGLKSLFCIILRYTNRLLIQNKKIIENNKWKLQKLLYTGLDT